uniref:MICOS complex subunit MIC13 n=1 Tax=Anolis carolinensis TaxID=28377 RepID=H9GNR4_ANOCA
FGFVYSALSSVSYRWLKRREKGRVSLRNNGDTNFPQSEPFPKSLARIRQQRKKRCGRALCCPWLSWRPASSSDQVSREGGFIFIIRNKKFLLKGGLAGGSVYVVYNQGLLGGGEEGAQALHKAKEALPPAVEEWAKYFGWQVPAIPKTDFSLCNAWNSGVRTVIGGLSVAPTRASEYTQYGWKYMKDLVK